MNLTKSIIAVVLFLSSFAFAQEKIKMNSNNEEVTKMIETYSKATGQKFIIDSTVRGKATVFNSEEVTYEEAFNIISEVLALNGFAMIKKDNVYVVRNARSAQRDGIEVYTTLPKAKPERMATWVVTLKTVSAAEIRSQMGRLLNSSYGELEANLKTNQLIVTDFTSSINRIAEMIKEIDQPLKPGLEKIVAQAEKERAARRAEKKADDKLKEKAAVETKEATESKEKK